jgi:type IV pilus assembly protein PilA
MSKLIRKSNKGFTLIELMIVVAIIGILAAIAIPNFLRFQLKSKSSEGKVNIAAIRTAEESYLAEFGVYVAAGASPAGATPPGTGKAAFVNADGANLGFDQLGWSPEGQVFFQYAVNYLPASPSAYTISAAADIDGDATNQVWGYVKPVTSTAAGVAPIAAHGICTNAGIVNSQLTTVGPCAAAHGQSIF